MDKMAAWLLLGPRLSRSHAERGLGVTESPCLASKSGVLQNSEFTSTSPEGLKKSPVENHHSGVYPGLNSTNVGNLCEKEIGGVVWD